MSVQTDIEAKLANALDLQHLEVINESANHNVPAGSESHFKVVMVSEAFADKGLIQRHRLVNQLLAQELSERIHALALHTYTEAEWQQRSAGAPMSPPCLGGSKGA